MAVDEQHAREQATDRTVSLSETALTDDDLKTLIEMGGELQPYAETLLERL